MDRLGREKRERERGGGGNCRGIGRTMGKEETRCRKQEFLYTVYVEGRYIYYENISRFCEKEAIWIKS